MKNSRFVEDYISKDKSDFYKFVGIAVPIIVAFITYIIIHH